MNTNNEREKIVGQYVPKGPPVEQSAFKDAVCIAFAAGRSGHEAIEMGRRALPGFTPTYDPAFLDLL